MQWGVHFCVHLEVLELYTNEKKVAPALRPTLLNINLISLLVLLQTKLNRK